MIVRIPGIISPETIGKWQTVKYKNYDAFAQYEIAGKQNLSTYPNCELYTINTINNKEGYSETSFFWNF